MAYRIDMAGVKGKLDSIMENPRLGRFAATTAAEDMEPHVPRREGALRASAVIEPFRVIYKAPYAVFQFLGRYGSYTTPGTGRRWDERADKGSIARAITQWIKRYM